MIKKYNFDVVFLEDLIFSEKIKLFQESEVIISTLGSQLTFVLFSNLKSKIIEICKNGEQGHAIDNNINIGKHLNLNYLRYSNISEDRLGNFNLDINKFEKFLIKHI